MYFYDHDNGPAPVNTAPLPPKPKPAPAPAPVAPAPAATAPAPAKPNVPTPVSGDPVPAPAPVAQPAPAPAPAAPAPAPMPPAVAPGTTDPFAAQQQAAAAAGQYDPTTGTFDESKGVEGRVASITSKGGPLMQLAETRAKQSANRLGLANSSMAVGAAHKALVDAALPIATADAEAFQRQALTNQGDVNTAAAQNAQIRANAATEGMRLGESARQNDASLMQQADQAQRERDLRTTLAQLDRDQQTAVVNLENQWRSQLQTNEQLAKAWGTKMDVINQIQMNADLDPETKKTLVENALAEFSTIANWSSKVSGVNVDDLLNFGTAPPAAGGAAPAPGPAPAPAPNTAPKVGSAEWVAQMQRDMAAQQGQG